jgi:diguanylate cyclase (GGDEF)-like protein
MFKPIVNIKSGKLYAVEVQLVNTEQNENFKSIYRIFSEATDESILHILDQELRKKAFEKFEKIQIENVRIFYTIDSRVIYMPNSDESNICKIENINIDKKAITFQISEKTSSSDQYVTTSLISKYKDKGFDISISDFGDGITGIKLLYNSNINYVKLNKSFIFDIHNNMKKRMFCISIVNLAHIMGIKVISGGIDEKQDYYNCVDIGVDFIQGHYVQKEQLDINNIHKRYEQISNSFQNDKYSTNTNIIDKEQIEYIEPLKIDSNLNQLFTYFKENSHNTFVPIVDGINQLCGAIYERDIKDIAYSKYGISLSQNQNTKDKLKEFMKPVISADKNWGIDKVLEIYNMNIDNQSGIFITKNSQYNGFIDVNRLLLLSHSKNLETAKEQNPLTKLPGNKKIKEFIQSAFDNIEKAKYHIVYFDFNDFKPFNDHHGFRKGDNAILLFANILKQELPDDVFIAHIGGDDFFVGFTDFEYEPVFKYIDDIQILFKSEAMQYYTDTEVQKGCITTKDRFGIERKFNLLSVCSAIVELSNVDKGYLDKILSKIKKEAKKSIKPVGLSVI